MNLGSVLESYTVGSSNQVDEEEDADTDHDPLQDDGAVDTLKYEDIPLNTVIFTSGFATTHVVVSVRHPITY